MIAKKLIFLNFVMVLFLIGLTSAYQLEGLPFVSQDKTVVTTPNNKVKCDIIDEGLKYVFEEGGHLTIAYTNEVQGKEVTKTFTYSNLQDVDGKPPVLVTDLSGKLLEAHFKVGDSKSYLLGDEEIQLPEGAIVDFKDGKANIKYPSGQKLAAPKPINEDSGETVFEFTSPDGKFLFSGGNNFFQGNSLKFQNGQYFFDYNGQAKLNEVNIINNGKTFIDFNGKINTNYDGAYISIDDKNGIFVTGSNTDQRGPKISFTKNNPYGLRIQSDQDHFAIWSLGDEKKSYIKIQNRNSESRIPKMDTLNRFAMNFDKKTVHYASDKGKLYLSPKRVLIDGFTTGSSSLPLEVRSYHNKNGKVEPVSKRGNVLGVGDHVELAYGIDPRFIRTSSSYSNYASLKKGFSNSWLYYNLKTVRDMRRFLGKRNINDYSGVLNNPANVKWVTDLMAGLPAPVFNSIRTLNFGSNIGYAGLSHSDGTIQIGRSGFNPETIRHEITHAYQFASPRGFWNDWQSVGYRPNGQLSTWSRGTQGFAWGYGSKNWYEDGATFGDYIYNPEYWDNLISSRNSYNKIYRGKLAVMRKHKFITQGEYNNIFRRSGLDSSPSSVQKYINEARNFV